MTPFVSSALRALPSSALLLLTACSPSFLMPRDPYGLGWQEPFNNKTQLGGALESRFSNMLENCGVKRLDTEPRSAIPLILQQGLQDDLQRSVRTLEKESTWNLFRFVASSPQAPSVLTANLRDYLDAAIISQSMLPQPAPGSTALLHRQTCGSVVRAALEAELKVPGAAVAGALRSEFDDHSELAIVQGRFFSPLAQVLSANAPRRARTRALAGVWQWYLDRETAFRPDSLHFYVAGFDGLAVFTLRQAGRTTDQSLQMSGSAAGPIGGGDVLLQVTGGTQGKTELRDYATHVFVNFDKAFVVDTTSAKAVATQAGKSGPTTALHFLPLPTPFQISDAFRNISWRLIAPSAIRVRATAPQPQTLRFSSAELPSAWCDATLWKPWNPTPAPGTPPTGGSVLGISMTVAADSTCETSLLWQPGTPPRDGDAGAQMTLNVVSAAFIDIAPVGKDTARRAEYLWLSYPVSVNEDRSPTLEAHAVELRANRDATTGAASWLLSLRVLEDSPAVVQWDSTRINRTHPAMLHCGSGVMDAALHFVRRDSVRKTLDFRLEELGSTLEPTAEPTRTPARSCSAELAIDIPMLKGPAARRYLRIGPLQR